MYYEDMVDTCDFIGPVRLFSFFFNDTATTEIYTLSLHDALPISSRASCVMFLEPRRSARTPKSIDRKSTRLNSSHANISYAVFCLKKKKVHKFVSCRHAGRAPAAQPSAPSNAVIPPYASPATSPLAREQPADSEPFFFF